eukprot:2407828-Prymnesium_polylepis.1
MRESQTSPIFCRFASGETRASTAASGEASSFAAASISNEGDSRALRWIAAGFALLWGRLVDPCR